MDSVCLSVCVKTQTLQTTQMILLDRISPLCSGIFNNYTLAHSHGQNKSTFALFSFLLDSISFEVFWVVFTISSRTWIKYRQRGNTFVTSWPQGDGIICGSCYCCLSSTCLREASHESVSLLDVVKAVEFIIGNRKATLKGQFTKITPKKWPITLFYQSSRYQGVTGHKVRK